MAFSTGSSSGNGYTLTALSRWSILDKQLPAVDRIKAIHVYDFDNTLFKTPTPNQKLWSGPTIGMLANPNSFVNGGWWHDSRILAATGEGLAVEEPRAWSAWWNEKIVELVELSMQQRDALCVLLTGRAEAGFSDLIKRMIVSKGLEFDMVSLKPAVGPNNQRFSSTMQFKQVFLTALMETYRGAEEIRVYEDRVKHVKGFRDFMAAYNQGLSSKGAAASRAPIQAEVIQVAELTTTLDPVVEVAEIQHLINAHNDSLVRPHRGPGAKSDRLMVKKTVFYTGYLIEPADTQRLLTLAQIPAIPSETDLKLHANNIMICPRPCPKSILDKVGGMGSKMKWEVTGTGSYDNSIWAVCLKPVPATAKFHTDNPSPLVVLAVRKGARPMDAGKIQNWQPIPADKAFVFDSTVGEKVILRIEAEDPSEGAYESLFPNKTSKRKHTGDEDSRPKAPNGYSGGQRNFHSGRGGANQARFRGGSHGGNKGGFKGHRGGGQSKRSGKGGNYFQYKSLDDMGTKENQGGFGQQVSYDDTQANGFHPPTQPQAQSQGYFNQGAYQYQAPPQAQQQQQQQQQQPQYGAWQGAPGFHPPQGPGRPGGAPGFGGGSGPDMNSYY
ncbi:tat pathway signal sequence [Thozetella sp. PMI_491]|nr:tat pathway signal sequence [Thozetella sp. PMI_491]